MKILHQMMNCEDACLGGCIRRAARLPGESVEKSLKNKQHVSINVTEMRLISI